MGESGVPQSLLGSNAFVGREREIAELVLACESGPDSDTHLFLIHGEPGIGKTRLCDELASRAKALGMMVLWGRCWEGGGAPPYWPWIQVIRGYFAALDPEKRNLMLESEAASDMVRQFAQIVPELRPAHPGGRSTDTDKVEPGAARFRIFDAVESLLRVGALSRPMLIILDDIHGADEASLAMLRFIARQLKAAPIVILATHRDAEVASSPSLSELIGEISREARAIPMRGLSKSEVRQFIALEAGNAPGDSLVTKLYQTTDGNPLFLEGIIRMLIAEHTIDSAVVMAGGFRIPVGVQEAIWRQLRVLSADTRSILAVAAAIGKEFDFDLCRNVAGASGNDAVRLLDEASRAGIVTPLNRGQYRFAHALIRDVVYQQLDTDSRIELHGKIAKRLEEVYRPHLDSHAAELAYHFREARLTEKAIDYSIRAGHAAFSVLAYSDAMEYFQAALELTERDGGDVLFRANLLRSLSWTAFEVDRAASLKHGEAAIALYESLGRVDLAANVHIILGLIFHYRGEPLFNAALASEHLRRADSAIAKEPATSSLAFLYFAIACHECHFLSVEKTAQAARRSMEISVQLDNKVIWPAAAAFYAWTLCMKGKLREGFGLFDEATIAAKQAGIQAYSQAWGAGMFRGWLGDPRGAREKFALELIRNREEFAPLNHRWLSRLSDEAQIEEGNLCAALENRGYGDFLVRFWIRGEWETVAAEMGHEADKLYAIGDNIHGALYLSWWAGLAYLLFLGDYARAEKLFKFGLDNPDRGPVVALEMRARPWLARAYVAMNRLDEATEQVARCRQIMAEGEDWRGLVGSVARAEAAIEAARGNFENASRLLASALAIHRQYHAAWEEADTLTLWGRVLAAAVALNAASEKFDAATAMYRSCGVGPRLIEWLTTEKAHALAATRSKIASEPTVDWSDSKAAAEFRMEGDIWTIAYGGASFRLKDAKGLRYLSCLLARPGERFHSKDLVTIVEGSSVGRTIGDRVADANLTIANDLDGAPVRADSRARSEYRERLRDLKAELDIADQANDIGRAERLREELDFLTEEFASTSGIRNRTRQSSSHAERVRVMVGKNIRSAIEKIRRHSAPLGRHLANTIRTGYFCTYDPDRDHPVSWQL